MRDFLYFVCDANFEIFSFILSFVAGAGATEIELAQMLLQYADTLPGLEQYAVRKFAVALEAVPRALADNSGANATDVVNNMYKAHRVRILLVI